MTIIKEVPVKNLTGICIENDSLRVTVLPLLGGKTSSLFFKKKQFELAAQTDLKSYVIPNAKTPFEQCDASGFDDAFPTIDAMKANTTTFSYTDHGEIWRSSFKVKKELDGITLFYKSKENPFSFKKTISLSDHCVTYSYEITNTGTIEFPCFYTWHGLFTYAEDMRFIYPEGTEKILNVFDSNELNRAGTQYKFPDDGYDFSKVPKRDSKTAVKYYLSEPLTEGFCAYEYPKDKVRAIMNFDEINLPYLGMWITAGGFRTDYNCAFEPSSGYYDGIEMAQKNDALWVLKPGEKKQFKISIDCEAIGEE